MEETGISMTREEEMARLLRIPTDQEEMDVLLQTLSSK